LAVKPHEGLLEVRSALREALTKSLALRETIISENGAVLYPTLIGIEEYPKVQAASAEFDTVPLVLPTITFKYGKGVYLEAVDVAVNVTQYQDKAVVEAVPIEAQVETSPYLATKLAGEVTKVVPSIANEISLLNLVPAAPVGIIHNPAVKVP
jgi:hypothetical protein